MVAHAHGNGVKVSSQINAARTPPLANAPPRDQDRSRDGRNMMATKANDQ